MSMVISNSTVNCKLYPHQTDLQLNMNFSGESNRCKEKCTKGLRKILSL